MSVSILRCFLCWAMVVIIPVSLLGQTPSAILHTQGGVWVNGSEARDASAIFDDDLVETKPGFSATLNLEGTSVLIQPESVAKYQRDLLALDHGSVAVETSTGYKVRVNCITVIPVQNEWTQYEVTNLNGVIQVAARKNDVKVEMGLGRRKASAKPETSSDAVVHGGEQASYHESEVCGAPARITGTTLGVSPKWIAVGAGAAGVLIWVLVQGGGGKTPVSVSAP